MLWPWPNGVGAIESEVEDQVDGTAMDLPATFGDAWLPIVLAIVAFVVVMGLNSLAPAEDHTPVPEPALSD